MNTVDSKVPNPQIEEMLRVAAQVVNGKMNPPENKVEPYDWMKISASRFNLSEQPKPRDFLVEGFLPLGIVGTICSRGGIGKSVQTLELAIRIALAAEGMESNWLCKFPVIRGGKVIILTGEDSEEDINYRLYHLKKVIAGEGFANEGFIQKAISDHIGIINFWGATEPYALLQKDRTGIHKTRQFQQLLKTIQKENPVLVVVDTRSRFAGGAVDENSNSDVPVEVAMYEALAGKGPTVLVCHHANKSSYQAGNDNAGAFRGASAWQDNLRWSLQLQPVKAADGSPCIRVELPKSNYTAPMEPFHLRRLQEPKFGFALAEGVTIDSKEAKLEADLDTVKDFIKKHPGQTQTEIMKSMKGQNGKPGILSWGRAGKAIKYGLDTGDLAVTDGGFLTKGEE